MRTIIHIDFNSFFASCEQQANPRLRGKPIGVTGGDRLTRTVVGAASVEAKLRGVKTAMRIPEALKICPDLILVKGDSDKYLEVTKRFLNILKDYSPFVEIFSIDEVFLELAPGLGSVNADFPLRRGPVGTQPQSTSSFASLTAGAHRGAPLPATPLQGEEGFANSFLEGIRVAMEIKRRIAGEVGEWVTCSVGISYNKMLSKLGGSLYKKDGLVVIGDEEAAQFLLDRVDLSDVCGIGFRTKLRLNNMGVFSFTDLRKVPLKNLLASFKSYGQVLYNFSRGIDPAPVQPFYEKEEVKSVGHRHTISHDVSDSEEIKQILLKLSEMVARRLRAKKLEGRTISFWYRAAFSKEYFEQTGSKFYGEGMQCTVFYTNDGLDIFKAGFEMFLKIWKKEPVRMVGISVSNLRATTPANLCFLEDINRREVITRALDKVNDRYGEFTLQRGILLGSKKLKRMPNSFLSDRRFKI